LTTFWVLVGANGSSRSLFLDWGVGEDLQIRPVNKEAELTVALLLRLKQRYGDLNRALVGEHRAAYGVASVSSIAQDLGLNRSVVRRALQGLSESDG
tara:strand:- start:3283 stop:3573 length:291 start_codon:yes stop_codon:yes gene_type:complete